MSAVRLCPRCSAQIAEDAPLNVCPSCLMKQAMEETAEAIDVRSPGGSGYVDGDAAVELPPGTVIGRYTIVEKLGAGGFGAVYKATQKSPVRRTVAIKIIKAGLDTKEFIARFEGERQALARMDHPNIARMFDAGSTRHGRPYFVMEYIPGKPITTFADENQFTVRQRLELFRQVCGAVGHAHTKAMIHRDIKSSNVMAFIQDDHPVVKVIDFGIAKAIGGDHLSGQTLNTAQGQALGTFDAMSPEQAAGSPDIDTRTDVYAMGTLLYELLTGCKPFDWPNTAGGEQEEIRRMIREVEPPRPSTRLHSSGSSSASIARYRKTTTDRLIRDLRNELEWIPIKAMRKNRAERYASTAEFDDDIVRFLEGRPLVAGPDSFGYVARKYLWRYRGPLATAAGVFALIALTVIFYVQGIRHERQRADDARHVAEQLRAISERQTALAKTSAEKAEAAANDARLKTVIASRAAARSDARYLTQQNLLTAAFDRASEAWQLGGQWEDGFTVSEIASAASAHWELIGSVAAPDADMGCFVMEKDQKALAIASGGSILAFDATTGALLGRATADPGLTRLLPDETDNSVIACCTSSITRLELPTLKPAAHRLLDLPIHFADLNAGRLLIIHTGGDCRIIKARDLSEIDLLKWADQPQLKDLPLPSQGCINPSGTLVAVHGGNWWKESVLWKRDGQKPLLAAATLRVSRMNFADDEHLETWFVPDINGGSDSELHLYDLGTLPDADNPIKNSIWRLVGDEDLKAANEIKCCHNSSGELFFVAAGSMGIGLAAMDNPITWIDRYANLFPADSVTPEYLCSSSNAEMIALRRAGDTLIFRARGEPERANITSDFCGTICDGGQFVIDHDGTPDHVALNFTPYDCRFPSQKWKLNWIPRTPEVSFSYPWAICATPSSSMIVVIAQDSPSTNVAGTVYGKVHAIVFRRSDLRQGTEGWPISKVIDLPVAPGSNWTNRFAAIDPDGLVVLNWNRGGQPQRFSLSDGRQLEPLPAMAIACRSDNGRYVAGVESATGIPQVFEVASGRLVTRLPRQERCIGMCFCSDSSRVYVADGTQIAAYEVSSGKELSSIKTNLLPLAFSTSGDRFAALQKDPGSRGADGNIVLADTNNGNVVVVIGRGGTSFCPSSFSPDGLSLAIVLNRWRAHIFHAMTPSQLVEALQSYRSTPSPIPALSPPPQALPQEALAQPLGEPLDAAQSLKAWLGKRVEIQGTIQATSWTVAHNSLNLEFNGPEESRTMCWIPPKALPKFVAALGGNLDVSLRGKRVIVSGLLVKYGGKISTWRRRLQIQLDDPLQLKTLPANQ